MAKHPTARSDSWSAGEARLNFVQRTAAGATFGTQIHVFEAHDLTDLIKQRRGLCHKHS